jgi:hypothetical protein
MTSKPTFRESLAYSPFNNLTPLLEQEYFITFNAFVCVIIVVNFSHFFLGGVPFLDYRVMFVLRETSYN